MILLSLSDEDHCKFVEEQTSSRLWVKPKKFFLIKSICNMLSLTMMLFGLYVMFQKY